MNERVNHPKHYNRIPGIECIQVVRHFKFNIGNVIKYLWRADPENPEEFKVNHYKALWYLIDEIESYGWETPAPKAEHKTFTKEEMNELIKALGYYADVRVPQLTYEEGERGKLKYKSMLGAIQRKLVHWLFELEEAETASKEAENVEAAGQALSTD